MDELSIANLLQEARAAAVAGDRDEAIDLTRQALESNPDAKDAWLLLASFEDDADAKRQDLQRVLALDPFNQEAKAALARLDRNHQHVHEPVAGTEVLYCANHPDRETMLRCNRCNKPICMECAVLTPVGYRCRECVREQQNKFYTATGTNQVLGYVGAGISGVLLGLGALLVSILPLGIWGILIAIFAGPAIGGGLSELIWRASDRKRARGFNLYATGIVALLAILIALPAVLLTSRNLFGLITAGVVVFTALSAIYARLH